MWDRICLERYGVQDPKLRRFRYGIQVNSLGLTDRQPENNVARIIYEMLGVVLTKRSRARSVQLPAWNEALGLPRKWDQQWSLRMQQILAFETDLLEYEDLFEGSAVVAHKETELEQAAQDELQKILEMGGAVTAIENGYMKRCLVESNAIRLGNIESGQQIVVGVNQYCDSEPSPLVNNMSRAFLTVDDTVEAEQIAGLQAFRKKREAAQTTAALEDLKRSVQEGRSIVKASIECAEAGVSTGEWADALREVFGEYRAPTGVEGISQPHGDQDEVALLIEKVKHLNAQLGRNLKILVGKPGLDGHSNGAEQVAVKARDVGMEVVYEGIRLTPEQIAETAMQEGVHVIGLSILSGSHTSLVPEVVRCLEERGLTEIPIVLGGIIPEEDVNQMKLAAVKKVYAPKDYRLNRIMSDIIDLVAQAHDIDLMKTA